MDKVGFWCVVYHRGQLLCVRWGSRSTCKKGVPLRGWVVDLEISQLWLCHGWPSQVLLFNQPLVDFMDHISFLLLILRHSVKALKNAAAFYSNIKMQRKCTNVLFNFIIIEHNFCEVISCGEVHKHIFCHFLLCSDVTALQ